MIRSIDYAALIAARATLSETADELAKAARDAHSHDTADLTRVAVLCEIAEDAIFNALNSAHAYLDDPESGTALFPERSS